LPLIAERGQAERQVVAAMRAASHADPASGVPTAVPRVA
jgi:hypothetical protein